jgi:hypothetical protein
MDHMCLAEECSLPLNRGARVIQLLRGTSFMGYITPAWGNVLAEWHEGCFHEFELNPQSRPYRCQLCSGRIEHGDEVLCFVRGEETSSEYSVAERRGYEIYSVRHVRCQVQTENPL